MQPMYTTYQQMITESFNSETYVQNRMDIQHTPIYDTVTVAAGAALNSLTSAFFTNVGSNSLKTLGLTNMDQTRKLSAPEAFSIFSYRLRWAEDILRLDILTILSRFALEFYIGQKVYQRGPAWVYGAGGGLFAVTTRTAESNYTNGLPSRESMNKLAIPLVIENQASFYAQLTGTEFTLTAAASGGNGITMQLVLDGLYARGVQ